MDSSVFAVEMGLRYVRDDEPGFTRRKKGKSFVYLDDEGNKVSHDKTLHRIQALVLPPAWESVWICRFANGHLQATGRDDRSRKQYRYHEQWSTLRNETKFGKLSLFGECLPDLRREIDKHLKGEGLGRDRVLAAVLKTMEQTHIRVGNDTYAEQNESYGLTTIRNKHVKVLGDEIKFKFKGKSGVLHDSSFEDKRLSRIIRACQDLPGEELFAYEDADGTVHDVKSDDVNRYLRELTGESITAKDFRTWAGSVAAARTLNEMGPAGELSDRQRRSRELRAIEAAAHDLGNTTTVCRKYYVHPAVLEADREGRLQKIFAKAKKGGGRSAAENALMTILK